MTADEHEAESPWWQGGSDAMPDIEALLGPEAMAAVGGVAEEALKLFVVLRERVAEPPPGAAGQQPGPAQGGESPLGGLLTQLASGAVSAVNELASVAQQQDWSMLQGRSGGSSQPAEEAPVAPGDAAACAYCPLCQAIALFRSVPMDTSQRLAASVVDVADAARDFTGPTVADGAVVVVPDEAPAASQGTVEDFLATVDGPGDGDPPDAGAEPSASEQASEEDDVQ